MFNFRPLAMLIAATLPAAANAQSPEVEQRVREEVQLVLVRMIESGAFAGTASDEIAFTLDEPAQRVTNLGLLVDSASAERAKDGLRVLGVTPRSTAQRMGVRAGDVVTAVNGVPLANLGADANGHALAARTLRSSVDALPDGTKLEFALVRDGKPLAVSAPLASVTLPPIHLKVGRDELVADTGSGALRPARAPRDENAGSTADGCGYLNVFDVAPRQDKLYGMRLLSVDGRLPGPTGAHQYKVPAGTHELNIAELIDPKQLSFNSRQRERHANKTLTVTVAPNTTYYLAAKLNPDARSGWTDGSYWEPVVWRETPQDCR
ncbi:PDZ domain-containing protein [Tahibacter soli]|uniref:PDZ domain-containing protein n=1 Tax=Tahibacter soli TaxID=2983605 RepID=A0A9X4BKI8_9GAMM|nr:PDZ domain-containing protein [Tahibacter soli]MDC8014307.1 PDZ domain-containing protein [Tahibacter soli]